MASFSFNTIFMTDMRDSKGSSMALVEITGIEGSYTSGGVVLDPQDFGLESIQFLGLNNFFAFPNDGEGGYDPEADWEKAVDIFPTQVVNEDGDIEWRLLIFLYAMDGAELPDGIPMQFISEVPIRMLVMGSNRPDRRNLNS